MAQAQLVAGLPDAALANAQTCLAVLGKPEMRPTVEMLIAQIQAAQPRTK